MTSAPTPCVGRWRGIEDTVRTETATAIKQPIGVDELRKWSERSDGRAASRDYEKAIGWGKLKARRACWHISSNWWRKNE